MSAINNGGPAFPADPSWLDPRTRDESRQQAHGMSLRDWFAGKALAGLMANPGGPIQANGMSGWGLTNCDVSAVAKYCYALADAMLAEREKGGAA